jgi:hypothetical protein
LLIVPGGSFEDIGNGLTATTTSNIRKAVRGGLNYLGICAGAFFAGNSPYNGLNLTEACASHPSVSDGPLRDGRSSVWVFGDSVTPARKLRTVLPVVIERRRSGDLKTPTLG